MKIFAMILSVALTFTVVINLYGKHEPECRLCEKEIAMESMMFLEHTAFEHSNK